MRRKLLPQLHTQLTLGLFAEGDDAAIERIEAQLAAVDATLEVVQPPTIVEDAVEAIEVPSTEAGPAPVSPAAEVTDTAVDDDFAITFVADPLVIPEPVLWQPPSGFALPISPMDRAVANRSALDVLEDLLVTGRQPSAAEKATMALYTSGFLPTYHGALDMLRGGHEDPFLSEMTKNPPRGDERGEVFQAMVAATHAATEKYSPAGANALFLCCPAPALPSTCHPQFRKRARVTLHTLDRAGAKIASYLHQDVDIKTGAPARLTISQGFYDLAFLIQSPSVARMGDFGWGDRSHRVMSNLGKFLRPDGLFLAAVDREEFFSEDRYSRSNVRPIVMRAAFHESFDIIGHQSTTGRNRATDVIFSRRRSAAPEEECTYLSGSYASSKLSVAPGDLTSSLVDTVKTGPDLVFTPSISIADQDAAVEGLRVPIGSFVRHEGKVYGNPFGAVRLVDFKTPVERDRTYDLLTIRDEARAVTRLRALGKADAYREALGNLEQRYDTFRAQYGSIRGGDNLSLIRADADLAVLCSLENKTAKEWEKSSFFKQPPLVIEKLPTSPQQALHATFRATGRIDFNDIAGVLGITPEQARAALASHVFEDPSTGRLQFAAEYLSGDVISKLEVATAAAAVDPRFKSNVAGLERVKPERIPISDISFSPASPWMPLEYVQKFAAATFGQGVTVEKEHGKWSVTTKTDSAAAVSNENTRVYAVSFKGEPLRSGIQIFRGLLTRGGTIEISIDDEAGKPVFNEGLSIIASEKAALLRRAFEKWIKDDPKRAAHVENVYNETLNRHVRPFADPDALSLCGLNPDFKPRKHQLVAALKGVVSNATCFNHFTGAGKTFVLGAVANERLVRGYNNKLALTVPKNTLLQTAREIQDLFPSMTIITAGPENLTRESKGSVAERIRNASQALVIMTYEAFQSVPLELKDGLAEENAAIRVLRAELEAASGKGEKKKIQGRLSKAIERRDRAATRSAKSAPYTFQQLGFDGFLVDEADALRNLKAEGPGNLSTQGNQLTDDFFLKLKLLREKHPNMTISMATATVLNRSITELYNYQRYLQPEALKRAKINSFYDWVNTFCESHPCIASTIDGQLVLKPNYTIVNATELSTMLSEVFDTVTESDVEDVKRPEISGGKPTIEVCPKSPEQEHLAADALRRVNCIRNGFKDPDTGKIIHVPPTLDNPLTIYSDAILAAIDPRLVDPSLPAPKDGKLAQCADRIVRHALASEKQKGVQLVFLDHHKFTEHVRDPITKKVISSEVLFSAPHELLRLVTSSGALSPAECVFVNDVTDAKLEQVYADAKVGKVRLLIGSGAKVGRGRNIQNKIIADHHLDIPWNPANIIQRNGRGHRQGNENDTIFRYYYITEGSGEAAVITDCARKAASFGAIWRASRSERSIQDINDFEANINDLVAELTDPRSAQLLSLRSEVNTLLTRKQVTERELAEISRNLSWYEERTVSSKSRVEKVTPIIDSFRAAGGFDKPVLELLKINGKTFESIDQANIELHGICSGGRDLRKPREIGTLGGLPVSIEKCFGGAFELTVGSGVGIHFEPEKLPYAWINLTKAARTQLPRIIEEANFDIERFSGNIARAREQEDRLGPLDAAITKAKADYEILLNDIERNPSSKPPLDAYRGIPRKYNELLSKPVTIRDGRRTGVIKGRGETTELVASPAAAGLATPWIDS